MNKNLTVILVCTLIFCLAYSPTKAQSCQVNDLYGWAATGSGTTGGKGGITVEVSSMDDLKTQAGKSEKLIIFVKGKLSGSFSINSNKTIIGYPGASVGGISISGKSNIIIRNIIVRGSKCNDYEACKAGSDGFSITKSKNIWIDHMDIADGQDGNLDITTASDLITVSWCKFSYTYVKEHAFSNLNGSADDLADDAGKLNITFHHNWWADRILQRQPRVRYGKIHVANNLYTSQVADYMVGVGMTAKVLIEGNIMKATGKPVEYFPNGNPSDVLTRNNIGSANANAETGSGFVPPYYMTIESATDALEAILRSCAGATLPDPRIINNLDSPDEVEVIAIAPNPFTNALNIRLQDGQKGMLMNMKGEEIASFSNSTNELNTANFPAGLYFIKIISGNSIQVIKAAKE